MSAAWKDVTPERARLAADDLDAIPDQLRRQDRIDVERASGMLRALADRVTIVSAECRATRTILSDLLGALKVCEECEARPATHHDGDHRVCCDVCRPKWDSLLDDESEPYALPEAPAVRRALALLEAE